MSARNYNLARIYRIAQPVCVALIGLSIFFWPYVSSVIPTLQLTQLVGATIAILAGVVFYFDDRLDKLINLGGPMEHADLTHCLQLAQKAVSHPTQIRIFALTTGQIQPIFRNVGFRSERCSILMFNGKFTDSKMKSDSIRKVIF